MVNVFSIPHPFLCILICGSIAQMVQAWNFFLTFLFATAFYYER